MNTRRTQSVRAGGREPRGGNGANGGRRRRDDDLLSTARAATGRTRQLRAQSEALADAQRLIREANDRFVELYDFVPIPYLIVSNVGIIQHVNEAGLQLLGGGREWIVGRPLIGYVGTADMRRVLDSVLSSSRSVSHAVEVHLRGREGDRVVQMTTRRRERDEAESQPTFHIAMVDLTETRRLEDSRRRAEQDRLRSEEAERVARAASEAKDEFLAMLSHELRTPLTPILAAADALMTHGALSPELTAKLEIIRRNVKAEARLIDDLLDVARITRNRLEVTRQAIDLHPLIEETVDAWRVPIGQHRLTLDVALDAPSHWVKADAGRLGQVFRNVFSNAVKFSEAGGRIAIRTESRDDRIRVTVTDTGAGMTAAQTEKLFKPFLGTKDTAPRHGLGLGLVISQAILQAHEGTLQVWSAGPGTGTTVRVELLTVPAPAVAARAAAAPAPRPQPPSAPATAKVLLVEDDPDSAEMLALLLGNEGFEVSIARSMYQARALADECEVLVSDISLPDGSGLDLMRSIHAWKPMRGLALSGYGSRHDVQKSLDAGFEEHLTKPVDLERFVAAVRRLAAQRA